jgi:hypothetical protein
MFFLTSFKYHICYVSCPLLTCIQTLPRISVPLLSLISGLPIVYPVGSGIILAESEADSRLLVPISGIRGAPGASEVGSD